VAGYDNDGIGHIREVFAPGPKHDELDLTTAGGAVCWRGQTDVINRLVAGVDWTALSQLADESELAGVVDTLGGLEYDLLYPATLQDAVDFATFLIRTTVDMQRFSDGLRAGGGGVPGCGGETRIVVVRRGEVEWVSQNYLTPHRKGGWAEGSWA